MMKTLSANTIKTTGSQTITYKGSPLTVAWGGEFYTAIHNGDVFRQTGMADLKKDIVNGWACNDCREDDMAWVLPMQTRNLSQPNKENTMSNTYEVEITIPRKPKLSGTTTFLTLAAAVYKVRNSLYMEPTRMGALQAIKEDGYASYTDEFGNTAVITKILSTK